MNLTYTAIATTSTALSIATIYAYANRYGKPSPSGKDWEDIPGPKSGVFFWLLGNTPQILAVFASPEITGFLVPIAQNPEWKSMCAMRIFGGRYLVINDPILMKEIMVKGLAPYADKNTSFTRLELVGSSAELMFGGTTIVSSWGHDWKWRRNVLSPWFQKSKILPTLFPFVIKKSSQLAEEMAALKGALVDVDLEFTKLTFSIITRYIFGLSDPEELDFSDIGGNYDTMHKHFKSMQSGFTDLWARLPLIGNTEWAHGNFKPSRDKLTTFISKAIDRALQRTADGDGRFNSVIAEIAKDQSYNSAHGSNTRVTLEREILLIIDAGFDTTSHTLSFIFYQLAKNPHAQDAIRDEIRNVMGENPDLSKITTEHLGKLTYLTTVVRETLRLLPIVPVIGATVQNDTVLDGYRVPKDTTILCNIRGAYSRPDLFPEPEKFLPERWLSKSSREVYDGFEDINKIGENNSQMPDLNFGLGPAACLGKNLAYLEIRTIVATLVDRFNIKLKPGFKLELTTNATMHARDGIWLMLEDRN